MPPTDRCLFYCKYNDLLNVRAVRSSETSQWLGHTWRRRLACPENSCGSTVHHCGAACLRSKEAHSKSSLCWATLLSLHCVLWSCTSHDSGRSVEVKRALPFIDLAARGHNTLTERGAPSNALRVRSKSPNPGMKLKMCAILELTLTIRELKVLTFRSSAPDPVFCGFGPKCPNFNRGPSNALEAWPQVLQSSLLFFKP